MFMRGELSRSTKLYQIDSRQDNRSFLISSYKFLQLLFDFVQNSWLLNIIFITFPTNYGAVRTLKPLLVDSMVTLCSNFALE